MDFLRFVLHLICRRNILCVSMCWCVFEFFLTRKIFPHCRNHKPLCMCYSYICVLSFAVWFSFPIPLKAVTYMLLRVLEMFKSRLRYFQFWIRVKHQTRPKMVEKFSILSICHVAPQYVYPCSQSLRLLTIKPLYLRIILTKKHLSWI